MAAPAKKSTAYVSGGQVLSSPPLTVRARRAVTDTYNFLGLYVVSFFSLDPYTAAQNSSFNTVSGAAPNAANGYNSRSGSGQRLGSNNSSGGWGSWFGGRGGAGGAGGSGSGGGGGGGGARPSGGRRVGTLSDLGGGSTHTHFVSSCGSCG